MKEQNEEINLINNKEFMAKTVTGIDVPVTAKGILYLCELKEKELIVFRTIFFNNSFDALYAYANTPNPASQLVMGETYEDLIDELDVLHQKMKDPDWITQLHEAI